LEPGLVQDIDELTNGDYDRSLIESLVPISVTINANMAGRVPAAKR
jgi:hypothetical protein